MLLTDMHGRFVLEILKEGYVDSYIGKVLLIWMGYHHNLLDYITAVCWKFMKNGISTWQNIIEQEFNLLIINKLDS